MYPSFFEFFKYTFGLELQFLKLFQTFGFFLVLAFISGGFILSRNFAFLEKRDWLIGITEDNVIGEAPSILPMILNGLFGAALGYKILHGILNSATLFENPQAFLLSKDGNVLGAVVLGLVFMGMYWWDKKKFQLPEPKQVKEKIMPSQRVSELLVVAAISGIAGAKIFASVEDWDNFVRDPLGSLLAFSGLTFYGGFIFGAIAVVYFARKKKIPLLRLMDCAGPALIVGYAVGRLGCHFSGDGDWGIPVIGPNKYIDAVYDYSKPEALSFIPDWLWAYNYPHNVAQDGVQMADCVGRYCRELVPAVFPTSVYEFVFGMIILFILMKFRNKMVIPGSLFALYLILNGMERFLIEVIRVNPRYDFLGLRPSLSQFIAIGLIAMGVLMWTILKSQGKKYGPLSDH